MQYIVLDLESTCWEKSNQDKTQEIIEIGAVKTGDNFKVINEFDVFVKPKLFPLLSEFCTKLTTIRQSDVDKGYSFPDALDRLIKWIGDGNYILITWGDYDIIHLKNNCKIHSIKFPKRLEKKHVNLKQEFARKRGIRPCGMDQALLMMHIPLDGTHHRGIDDARNIAKLALHVL